LLTASLRSTAPPGLGHDGTVHVGDQPEDTEASRAAGVAAIGSAWGIDDTAALEASKPDRIFKTVGDLETFLLEAL
jgi:phosphoglycolate phosphatase-like HAD superfamily hydrolase